MKLQLNIPVFVYKLFRCVILHYKCKVETEGMSYITF